MYNNIIMFLKKQRNFFACTYRRDAGAGSVCGGGVCKCGGTWLLPGGTRHHLWEHHPWARRLSPDHPGPVHRHPRSCQGYCWGEDAGDAGGRRRGVLHGLPPAGTHRRHRPGRRHFLHHRPQVPQLRQRHECKYCMHCTLYRTGLCILMCQILCVWPLIRSVISDICHKKKRT